MVVIFHIIVSLEASQSHIFSSLFAIVLHPFRHRSNWVQIQIIQIENSIGSCLQSCLKLK
ncbi:hypothetical protein V6Z11_A06G113700 [Gossypium hirsutum]